MLNAEKMAIMHAPRKKLGTQRSLYGGADTATPYDTGTVLEPAASSAQTVEMKLLCVSSEAGWTFGTRFVLLDKWECLKVLVAYRIKIRMTVLKKSGMGITPNRLCIRTKHETE
jgi:hypothetical protein